jgi:hypothetical protein
MHWNRANETIRRKAKRDAAKTYGKRPDSWWKKCIAAILSPNFFLVIFTGLLVIVGALPWCTLEKTDKTSRQIQRAWVGLDGIVEIDALETTPRLHVESHYRIKNFGNGPALKVVVSGWFETNLNLEMEKRAAKFACDGAVKFATGTVPMSPEMHNPGPFGYILFANQWHDEFIGSPGDPWTGESQPDMTHFKLIGCVAYIDQFRAVHWTRFCMEPDFYIGRQIMDKNVRLRFCALYNDTDESETQD